jgi:MFS family permease
VFTGELSSRSILPVLLTASILPFIQATVLAPILPQISQSFQDNPNATLWVRLMLVAPSATIVLSATSVGALLDHASRRVSLAVGLILYAVCGVATFLSTSLELMVLVRLALGISLAVLMTATTALIADYFTGAAREAALGRQNALRGLTNTAAPILGALLSVIDWRLVFLLNLVSLPLVWLALRLPKLPRSEAPVVQNFPHRRVLAIYSLAFSGFLILYLLTLQIGFHLKELGMESSVTTAFSLAIAALTAAASSTQYHRLRNRLSFETIAAVAYLLMSSGYCLIGFASTLPGIAVGLVLSGIGFGMNAPNCSAWLLSKVPAGARGRALGALTTAIFLGQIASPFIYEPLVRLLGSADAFLTVASVSLLIALAISLSSGRKLVPAG